MLLNLAERWEVFARLQGLAGVARLRDIKDMANPSDIQKPDASGTPAPADTVKAPVKPAKPGETGGPTGPEPTRYGDWERGGRCIDF